LFIYFEKKKFFSEQESIQLLLKSSHLATEIRDQFWKNFQQNEIHANFKYKRLKPLVAASIGCYGASLADGSEYKGNYGLSIGELKNFHRNKISILKNSGVDLLACETIPCKVEAEALIQLFQEEFPDCWAWLSFSCKDEEHVCSGDLFSDCISLGNNCKQIVAIGINCTLPKYIENLLKLAKKVTNKPLIVYPNSGEIWDSVNHSWYKPNDLLPISKYVLLWKELGAYIIGGCCRTTPEDIYEIIKILK
jgi:homocysteine S-methyltransferase